MKLLLELNGVSIGLDEKEKFGVPYNLRKAARAVIFNDKNEIALLYVSKDNYHKLPGGGFESGEDVETALRRECLEETGSEIEIIDEIGLTIEYRNYKNLLQISYCYIAKSVGELSQPNFDKNELENGFQLVWTGLDEAISVLSSEHPNVSDGKYMNMRELAILKEAKRIMGSK